MREVTPKELREYNEKSWKETQKIFRRRLREIAAGGDKKAKYKPHDYCFGERIQPWLEDLGFKVKQVNPIWSEITWPEEEEILEKLRKEVNDIWSRRVPVNFTWGVKIEREEPGTWTKDNVQWDYVCSACGKHSEYATDFCCNCGKKMKVEEGEAKYDS